MLGPARPLSDEIFGALIGESGSHTTLWWREMDFELLVPRHKSRGFPQHSGHCGGIGGALKRYHLMVQPFFFCASNHSIEPGWGTV